MKMYPFCETKMVDVDTHEGVKQREAVVCGDLALTMHRSEEYYVIVHLPSGLSLGKAHCVFYKEDKGVDALMEIARLRNTWTFTDPAVWGELFEPIREIAQKHGGVEQVVLIPSPNGYKEHLNGYEE